MKFKFFDLFSGIGGFRMAAESVGGQCVGSCEKDRFARETYEANFDTKDHYFPKDVKDIELDKIPDFDILFAGFPCQSFSIAGRRRGLDDSRGNLFYDILEILKHKKPDKFLLENVRGLLSHEKGETFEKMLSFLEQLDYTVGHGVLNSKHLTAQSRNRVYIYGRKSDGSLLFPSLPEKLTPLKSILEENVDEKYFFSDDQIAKFKKSKTNYKATNRGFGFWVADPDKPSRTLLAHYAKDGREMLVPDGGRLRKLTPRECARLQGFPDSFKIVCNDSQAYKQFGNAVTVPVVESILETILG